MEGGSRRRKSADPVLPSRICASGEQGDGDWKFRRIGAEKGLFGVSSREGRGTSRPEAHRMTFPEPISSHHTSAWDLAPDRAEANPRKRRRKRDDRKERSR